MINIAGGLRKIKNDTTNIIPFVQCFSDVIHQLVPYLLNAHSWKTNWYFNNQCYAMFGAALRNILYPHQQKIKKKKKNDKHCQRP